MTAYDSIWQPPEFLSDDASNILKLIYIYAYGVMLSGFNLRLLFHQKPISPSQHPCLVYEYQLVCISCIKCRTEMDPTLSLEALDSYRDAMYLYKININHNGWASFNFQLPNDFLSIPPTPIPNPNPIEAGSALMVSRAQRRSSVRTTAAVRSTVGSAAARPSARPAASQRWAAGNGDGKHLKTRIGTSWKPHRMNSWYIMKSGMVVGQDGEEEKGLFPVGRWRVWS